MKHRCGVSRIAPPTSYVNEYNNEYKKCIPMMPIMMVLLVKGKGNILVLYGVGLAIIGHVLSS